MNRRFLVGATALSFLAAPLTAQEPQPSNPFEGIDFHGDFRIRAEFNDLSDSKDRHRLRLRFRYGANYTVSDELTFGARIVTGNPDDPNSVHVDMGDVFNTEMITLDRLFVTYSPDAVDGMKVDAGKFALRMQRNPVYGELVWDADVQPEGAQVTYGDKRRGATFGAFQLLHQSSSNDSWMGWLQGYMNFDMGQDSRVDTSLSFTYVGDPNPGLSTVIPDGDNPGDLNAETPGGQFLSDFGIANAIVAGHFGDFVVSGEGILNLRADDSVGDTGFAVGTSYEFPNQSKLYYQYQMIEQDAVLVVIAGDDDILPTNSASHILGYKIPTGENSNVNIWMITSTWDEVPAGATDDRVYRFRVDWNLNF